jgi:hypothetical protein
VEIVVRTGAYFNKLLLLIAKKVFTVSFLSVNILAGPNIHFLGGLK